MSIKIFIQTERFEGGPAIFRSRIIPLLNKFPDIKVTNNINDKFDIELAFIRKIFKHNKPYVLRVDGCYYEKSRRDGNEMIQKAILEANYRIFQSKFAFKLCNHILDIKNATSKENIDYSIIYNGIDLNYINNIKLNKKIKPGSFVACAQWRSNKRPISMIKGFLKANIKRHLYIIGGRGIQGEKIDNKYNSKYIHILGEKSNKETLSIMKACDYQIHLCHIDACPNTVIEGLACGLNVLCTNLGGTQELVQDNGVVLNVDKFWDRKYLKESKLDNINPEMIAEGIYKLMKRKERSIRLDLDINKMIKEYVDIIRENI